MISVLIVSTFSEEAHWIKDLYKDIAVKYSNDVWNYYLFTNYTSIPVFLNTVQNIDIACIDVTDEKGINIAECIRQRFSCCSIIIISDKTISPLRYIKPSITASSLLLRPFDKDCRFVLKDVFDEYVKAYFNDSMESSYCIENKDGKQIVPYNQIFYFESREKRIILATDHREFRFYDTLDRLEKQLPKGFIRCHRSFIVSREKIVSIKLSQHSIHLTNGGIVPISRTYKDAIKEIR